MQAPKVLFIISNLGEGGVSKSLVNLMSTLDRQKYDVTLLVCGGRGGLLEPLLPKDLKVVTDPVMTALGQGAKGLKTLIKKGHLGLAICHLLRLGLSAAKMRSQAGVLMARLMPVPAEIDREWDAVVDYNGQQQLYYMVRKLRARRKYTFFHSDYSIWPYYYGADKKYMPLTDGIFTISESCVEALRRWFPDCAKKVGVIENISNPAVIRQLADAPVSDIDNNGKILVTLGHITKLKGADIALDAAKILKERGIKYNWYFIGKVGDDEDWRGRMTALGLEDCVHFLGLKVNPYPYVAAADVIVHPSRFEGKSIALDEAKILCRPIVVTDFSTVHDQFADGVNATIVPMRPDAVADAVADLLEHPYKAQQYTLWLAEHPTDNTEEAAKYDRLFN